MHINRRRPEPGCDLMLWLSEVVNDAARDATEAGLPAAHTARVLLNLAAAWGHGKGCLSPNEMRRIVDRSIG